MTRWPKTFGHERIVLIEELSRLTGHAEQDLCRALRGISVYEVCGLVSSTGQSSTRQRLDQLVQKVRAR